MFFQCCGRWGFEGCCCCHIDGSQLQSKSERENGLESAQTVVSRMGAIGGVRQLFLDSLV